MKKILSLVLAIVMVMGLFAASAAADASNVKIGFIFLHDENSTYDLNFLNAAVEACEKLGVEYVMKKNIPEGNECYEAAADLADSGCNIVFADWWAPMTIWDCWAWRKISVSWTVGITPLRIRWSKSWPGPTLGS